jgi:hypothetical protein
MIVSSHQKGWKVITQRSHGLLASMLAYQYAIDLPNDSIVPTIIAIAEHDDGIQETLTKKNLTEAGAPRDFRVSDGSTKTDLTQLLNVMEIASAKSQLNALLTSFHIQLLHDSEKRKTDKSLDDFLTKQENYRVTTLKNLGINQKYADQLYQFMEWCDAFSLLICLDKIQPEGRKMDVSLSPDSDMSQTYYKPDKAISVEPWPFKNDTFTVFYEYKILEQLKFESIEEFNDVYKGAEVQRQVFTFSR